MAFSLKGAIVASFFEFNVISCFFESYADSPPLKRVIGPNISIPWHRCCSITILAELLKRRMERSNKENRSRQ